MAWRLAKSLSVLRDEVNAAHPNRSRASDGTVGDAAHASRTSDHNPNSGGVVRAWDKTAFGNRADENAYCEHIISLARAGHPALGPGAYIISNGRIATANNGWVWHPYAGSNKHDKHTHLSVTTVAGADGYDALAGWAIGGHVTPHPKEKVAPMYKPPLGPIAAVLRVKEDPYSGPIVCAASPEGGVYCWATEFVGQCSGRDFFKGREVAKLYWAADGHYGIEATSGEKYEPRDGK